MWNKLNSISIIFLALSIIMLNFNFYIRIKQLEERINMLELKNNWYYKACIETWFDNLELNYNWNIYNYNCENDKIDNNYKEWDDWISQICEPDFNSSWQTIGTTCTDILKNNLWIN